MAVNYVPKNVLGAGYEAGLLKQVLFLRLGIENILASDETEVSQIMLDLRKLLDESEQPKQE